MIVTNYITHPNYVNWIKYFVCKVLKQADIQPSNVVISCVSFSGLIYINVDSIEYRIIILNSEPVKYDCYGKSCCENILYELYIMVSDELGSHAEEFHNVNLVIYL